VVDSSPAAALPVLHAVTNDEIVGRPHFIESARAIMRAMGPRGALQLRAARMALDRPARFVELALTLVEEQERSGAWLVINDRVDVALIACARGVQLTRYSLDVTDAMEVLAKSGASCSASSPRAIGASVHSLEEGTAARLAGAAWGVVSDVLGPAAQRREDRVAEPPLKDESGAALLEQLVKYSGLPIVTIGGIAPHHVASLRRAGAYGVAAIRGIWDAEHSEHAVLDYLSGYDSEVGR
jgi:thiamine-phosphate pyrophosphorylase